MTKRTKPRRVKALTLHSEWDNPYWAIPRTAAAYDALVEQLAAAAANYTGPDGYDGMVRAQLRTANITRPPATNHDH